MDPPTTKKEISAIVFLLDKKGWTKSKIPKKRRGEKRLESFWFFLLHVVERVLGEEAT